MDIPFGQWPSLATAIVSNTKKLEAGELSSKMAVSNISHSSNQRIHLTDTYEDDPMHITSSLQSDNMDSVWVPILGSSLYFFFYGTSLVDLCLHQHPRYVPASSIHGTEYTKSIPVRNCIQSHHRSSNHSVLTYSVDRAESDKDPSLKRLVATP